MAGNKRPLYIQPWMDDQPPQPKKSAVSRDDGYDPPGMNKRPSQPKEPPSVSSLLAACQRRILRAEEQRLDNQLERLRQQLEENQPEPEDEGHADRQQGQPSGSAGAADDAGGLGTQEPPDVNDKFIAQLYHFADQVSAMHATMQELTGRSSGSRGD